MLPARGSTFGLCTSVPPAFQFWNASWIVCPPTTNSTCHRPTIEELLLPSPVGAAASCLLMDELTTALAVAIAARLSPHDARAVELNPIARTPHATSLGKSRVQIAFIILLLLSFGRVKSLHGIPHPVPGSPSISHLLFYRRPTWRQCKTDRNRYIPTTRLNSMKGLRLGGYSTSGGSSAERVDLLPQCLHNLPVQILEGAEMASRQVLART